MPNHYPLPTLRVIDLDSRWLFGIGRDMTAEERETAERHGITDNPPASVLGLTKDGYAAVVDKQMTQLFVAAPALYACLAPLMEKDWYKEGKDGMVTCSLDAGQVRTALGMIDDVFQIDPNTSTNQTPSEH